MKAAVLNAFGAPLAIQTLPDPVLGTGEVIIDVVAAGITSYAADVFSGARNYLLELPVVPGAGGIGRVRATARTRPGSRSATGSTATRRSARATTPPIPT
jgi:alcohol dehydrogenase